MERISFQAPFFYAQNGEKGYKLRDFADITIVSVIGVCLTVAALIAVFPLFSAVNLSADKDDKSFNLSFYLFGITVFKYRAIIDGFTLRVKQTLKKPYCVNIYDFLKKTDYKGIKILTNISLLSVEFIAETGAREASDLVIISSLNAAVNVIFGVLKGLRPNAKTNGTINVYEGATLTRAALQIKTVFNVLDLFTIFILNFWGKLKNAIGKQNKQRCGERA